MAVIVAEGVAAAQLPQLCLLALTTRLLVCLLALMTRLLACSRACDAVAQSAASAGVETGGSTFEHQFQPLQSSGFLAGSSSLESVDGNPAVSATAALLSSVPLSNDATLAATLKLVHTQDALAETIRYGPGNNVTTVTRGSIVVTVELSGWQFCGGAGGDTCTGTGGVPSVGAFVELDITVSSRQALSVVSEATASPATEAVLGFGAGQLRYAPYALSVGSDDSLTWESTVGAGSSLAPSLTPVDGTTAVLTVRLPRGAVASAQFIVDFERVVCTLGCPSGTYIAQDCGDFKGRQCLPCTTSPCAPGTFTSAACEGGEDKQCQECSPSCGEGTFQVAPCSDAGDVQCEACAVCGPGSLQVGDCEPESNTVCTCPPGTYGDPYSSIGCLTCDASCGDCDAFGPHGCRANGCVDGFFFNGSTAASECAPCTQCGQGTYVVWGCGPQQDTMCGSCSQACGDDGCTGPSDAQCLSCGPGFAPSSSGGCVQICEDPEDCQPCPEGHFFDAGSLQCQECSACLGDGVFVVASCSLGEDTACGACDGSCLTCDGPGATDCTSCLSGEYLLPSMDSAASAPMQETSVGSFEASTADSSGSGPGVSVLGECVQCTPSFPVTLVGQPSVTRMPQEDGTVLFHVACADGFVQAGSNNVSSLHTCDARNGELSGDIITCAEVLYVVQAVEVDGAEACPPGNLTAVVAATASSLVGGSASPSNVLDVSTNVICYASELYSGLKRVSMSLFVPVTDILTAILLVRAMQPHSWCTLATALPALSLVQPRLCWRSLLLHSAVSRACAASRHSGTPTRLPARTGPRCCPACPRAPCARSL